MVAKSAPLNRNANEHWLSPSWSICAAFLIGGSFFIGCQDKQPEPDKAELFAALASEPFAFELIASRRRVAASKLDCSTWIVLTSESIPAVGSRAKKRVRISSEQATVSSFPVSAIFNLLAEFDVPTNAVPHFKEETGRMIEWQKGAASIRVRECKVNSSSRLSVIEYCK